MFFSERKQLEQDIEMLVSIYGAQRNALISILQEVQRKYRCVDDYAMQVIAHLLDIHPVEVFGVVSFYHFFSHTPKGQYVILLSDCIAHNAEQKRAVSRQLQNDLGISFGQTTPDGWVTLDKTGCIGMCDQGPVLRVNGRIYTEMTADKVGAVLSDCVVEVSHGTFCEIRESSP